MTITSSVSCDFTLSVGITKGSIPFTRTFYIKMTSQLNLNVLYMSELRRVNQVIFLNDNFFEFGTSFFYY